MTKNYFKLVTGSILVLCGAILLLLRKSLVVVTVENKSMSPTLENGDRVLVTRYWPSSWLSRGRIVVVWPWYKEPNGPAPFGVEAPFIKRIIGLGGDRLVTSLAEMDKLSREQAKTIYDSEGKRSWDVPQGQYFVRGDHPIGGFDSLSWGPVAQDKILGVVLCKLPNK